MPSSLSPSFLLLLLLLLLLDGLLPVAAAADRSIVPRIRARHSRTQLLLSFPSLTFPLFLLCFFSGFSTFAFAAPSPSPTPALAPPPPATPALAPTPAPTAGTTPPFSSELSSLLSLKESWKDPLNRLSSWNTSLSTLYCHTWRGVSCSDDNVTITSLNLAYFSLIGPLPASIANLGSLHLLNLAYNQLTGNIPPQLGSLSSLKILHLRHNLFNGSIPDTLFQVTSLRYLLLESNTLSGNISSSISNLVNLMYFSFANNALSGPLPASITNLTKLSFLYGGYNMLTGTIPGSIGDLPRLINLYLHGNLLTGDIPSSIGSCSGLQKLDLSNNQLTGTLPLELSNLAALQTLDLHQNNLSGSISPTLGNLSKLISLNLSYNNLSGEVPTNGVLKNFPATSFEGNALLCGGPLQCVLSPPPTLVPPPSPTRDTPPINNKPSKSSDKRKIVIGVVVGTFLLSLLILCVAFLLRRWRPMETAQIQNRLAPDQSEIVSNSKMEMYTKGFKLRYEEIVAHAGYYDTAHVVGKGRFATVYRSDLPGGTHMAVKVFKNPILQAAFEKELEGLESVSHFNTLLPIRGYFVSDGEKAIFYDFMQKGTLYDVLHNNPEAPAQLDWAKRLNIAMGVAQAMVHLHKGSSIRVLHKDLKSTNVVLDEAMNPLVADYGLIGLVSRSLVETPGYTPPELKTIKKYTEKTDVYSFGVVLLELLTGKKPVSYIGDRQLHLVTWALRLHRDGRGREVFSANLVESCPYPDYPDRALNLAILCLSDQAAQRPTMSEIASILEGLGGNNSPIRSPGIQQDRPLLV